MILFDMTFELTLGAACAWLSPTTKSFRAGLLVAAGVYVPTCIYAAMVWPGWQSMYLVDWPPMLISVVSSVMLVAAYVVGFVVGKRVVPTRGVLAAVAAAWAVMLSVLFIALWRSSFVVTSFADFHARRDFSITWGTPESLLGGPVSVFLVISGAIVLTALGVLWTRLRALRG